MARLPRPDLPGIPQHIVQRGNNRLPCFLDDEDRQPKRGQVHLSGCGAGRCRVARSVGLRGLGLHCTA